MDADLLDDRLLAQRLIDGARRPDDLREAGRHLAVRLHELAQDDALWSALLRHGESAGTAAVQLAVLPLVDWTGLLTAMRYQEPPMLAFAAGQGKHLLRKAMDSGHAEDWITLREHLAWLAGRLGKESSESWARQEGDRIRRLKYEAAEAFAVVRRLDLAKLLLDTAPKVTEAVFAAFAPPGANLALVLTSMAVKLGLATARDLADARTMIQTEQQERFLVELVASSAFRPATPARLQVALGALSASIEQAIDDAGGHPELVPAHDLVAEALERAEESERLGTFMSAELFAAWGYVAVLDPDHLDTLTSLSQDLTGMAQAHRDLCRAADADDLREVGRSLQRLAEHQQRLGPALAQTMEGLGPNLGQRHTRGIRM